MRPLLTASQMSNIQSQAARTFQTEATLRRPRIGTEDDDDARAGLDLIGTVMGWLTSAPTAEGTVDSGSIVTANTYRWNCAVGTDIKPRDLLDIGDNRYVVTDTTADETWPTMLSVSLRLRE